MRDDDETVDRLSLLPESLIFEILSFLETRDVVRTSLLSKGWKDIWTTIPYLVFNDNFRNPHVRNLIDGVLQRWKGTKISKFKISLGKIDDLTILSDDMARWVGFATENKVEDLDLYSFLSCSELPDCLYSCSSIVNLRLKGYKFSSKRGIIMPWNRLKSLEIDCDGLNEELFHQLVSSTPQLQVLCAKLESQYSGNISIRSSCLKRLTLSTYFSSTKTITILAPNLEELSLTGFAYSTRWQLSSPALKDANLCFFYESDEEDEEDTLKPLFLSIHHVEALALQISDYKRLIRFAQGECLFSNVKILKLTGSYVLPKHVAGLADFFPKVQKLIIDCDWSSCNFLKKMYSDPEANNYLKSLVQLKTVEVIWCHSWSWNLAYVYIFIEFLLKCAAMAQKIVIRKGELCPLKPEESLAPATKLLQELQRSFPALDVILCKT